MVFVGVLQYLREALSRGQTARAQTGHTALPAKQRKWNEWSHWHVTVVWPRPTALPQAAQQDGDPAAGGGACANHAGAGAGAWYCWYSDVPAAWNGCCGAGAGSGCCKGRKLNEEGCPGGGPTPTGGRKV